MQENQFRSPFAVGNLHNKVVWRNLHVNVINSMAALHVTPHTNTHPHTQPHMHIHIHMRLRLEYLCECAWVFVFFSPFSRRTNSLFHVWRLQKWKV